MVRNNEAEQEFIQRKSLEALGSDPAALNAVAWDQIEERPNADGTVTKIGHDNMTGTSRVIAAEQPQAQPTDGGQPQENVHSQAFVKKVIEDGVSYDVRVMPDGSEHLLGKTGETKRGPSIMLRPPGFVTPPEPGAGKEGMPALGPDTGKKTAEGRAIIQNSDGSYSTERTITESVDGKWVNIPTIFGGKIVPPDEAVKIMQQNNWVDPDTNRAVKFFTNEHEAVAAAQERSKSLDEQLRLNGLVGDQPAAASQKPEPQKPFGELKAYAETNREMLRGEIHQKLMDAGLDRYTARKMAEEITGSNSELTDTPLGIGILDLMGGGLFFDTEEGARQFARGARAPEGEGKLDMTVGALQTLLGMLEAIPLAGLAAKYGKPALTKMLKGAAARVAEGKSPFPFGMSIEDVSRNATNPLVPSSEPFFSQALKTVKEAKTEKASGQQWLATLKNAGVKDEEIEWIGLDDFLRGKKSVTKQEVAEYIDANKVQIKEVLHEAADVIDETAPRLMIDDEPTNLSEMGFDDEWLINNDAVNGWEIEIRNADDGDYVDSAMIFQKLDRKKAEDRILDDLIDGLDLEDDADLISSYEDLRGSTGSLEDDLVGIMGKDEYHHALIRHGYSNDYEIISNSNGSYIGTTGTLDDAVSDARSWLEYIYEEEINAVGSGDTKWSEYTLPGGESYKELLITMEPKKVLPEDLFVGEMKLFNGDGRAMLEGRHAVEGVQEAAFKIGNEEGRITYWPETYGNGDKPQGPRYIVNSANLQNARFNSLEDAKDSILESASDGYIAKDNQYRSSHWDERNILAHVRFKDRTSTDGKKTLFIEEIQSDWHQAGRKRGYAPELRTKRLELIKAMQSDIEKREAMIPDVVEELVRLAKSTQVTPEAPLQQGLMVSDLAAGGGETSVRRAFENMIRSMPDAIRADKRIFEREIADTFGSSSLVGTRNEAKANLALRVMLEQHPKFNEIMQYNQQIRESEITVQNLSSVGVPDAPLKKSWHEMAYRRMVRWAAEHDYDQVAWTTGKAQADRYNLARYLNRIDVDRGEDGLYSIRGWGVNHHADGPGEQLAQAITPELLPEYVGKELADKITADIPSAGGKSYTGLDLAVGGEGMREFYDGILRKYAQKFGKKFGASVGKSEVITDTALTPHERDLLRQQWEEERRLAQQGPMLPGMDQADLGRAPALAGDNGGPSLFEATDAHAMDITDEMKATTMRDGLPLFQVAGIPVGAAQYASLTNEGQQPQQPKKPGEQQDAGMIQRFMRKLLGEGGAEMLRNPPSSFLKRQLAKPPPPGTLEALGRNWAPYKEVDDAGNILPTEGIDFNFDRMTTTDAAKQQINNVSRIYQERILDKTGGVVSHKVTRQVADLLGVDEEGAAAAIKKLPVDTKDLHVRALTMRDMLVKKAEEIDIAAVKIASDPAKVTDEELLAFRENFAQFAALQANMKGVQTDIARALSSFRIPADGSMGTMRRAHVISEALAQSGGKDTAMELAQRWIKTPVEDKGKLADKSWAAKARDAIFEVWINGLLSSPKTHEVNFFSNQVFALWQIPERAVAAGIGKVRQLMPNANPDRVSGMEAVALLHGFTESFGEASASAWKVFKTEQPTDMLTKIEASQHKAISAQAFGVDEASAFGKSIDLLGGILRIPGRALMSADEWQKVMTRGAERRALAMRFSDRALDEGKGVKEAAEIYSDVMTGNNPIANEAVNEFADITTFTKELLEKGKKFQAFINAVPGGRVVVPFIRTPANILKEVTKRTPLAPVLKEVRQDLAAGGAKRDLALAKIGLGSLSMMWASNLAAEGKITGGGPTDPKMKQVWLQKYEPYSININGKWYPYGRLEPIGLLFGIAADFTDFQKWAPAEVAQDDQDSLAVQAVASVLHTVSEKAFLMSIAEAAAAYKDPERYAEPYIARLTGSAMPYSSLARAITQATDPVSRTTKVDPYQDNPFRAEFDRTLNELKKRTPGFSTDLPPNTNFWGEDIKTYDGSWIQAFNLFAPREKSPQPIDDELLRLRYPIASPGAQVEGVRLSPQQYYNLKKAMNVIAVPVNGVDHPVNMREFMNITIKSPAYARLLTDQKRIEELQRIRNKFADAARTALVTPGGKWFDEKLFPVVVGARVRKPLGLPAVK